MKKIPTLYVRDRGTHLVTEEVTDGCEWVLAGEGVATRKYDGVCFRFDGSNWWARREVKPDRPEPVGYRVEEIDPVTGKKVGWESADLSSFHVLLEEAQRFAPDPLIPGTYELCGPKVNGNHEMYEVHVLVRHKDAQHLPQFDRPAADGSMPMANVRSSIADGLFTLPYEGVVWHHPDGHMAKIKRKDFWG